MSEREIILKQKLTPEEERLIALVDKNKGDIVKLVQDLVKIDSISYEPSIYSDLSAIFKYVENILKDNGFKTKMYFVPHIDSEGNKHEDQKWMNIIGIYDTERPGKVIQFNGHLDVVPYSIEKWKEDIHPLSGLVRDGKIYGRGALDMKSGVACALSALKILRNSDLSYNGKIQFWGVPDEEIDGHYGARYMSKEQKDVVNADVTIIGEATGQSPVKSPVIIVGEKGIQWFRFIFSGTSGHGSMPKNKSNSINKVNRFIANIKKLKLPKVKPPFSLFYMLKGLLSRFKLKELINAIKVVSVEEPDPFDEDGVSIKPFFNSTISFNQILAGEKVNVIPDTCTLCIDVRVLPGVTTQQIFDSFAKYATRIRYKIQFPDGFNNIQSSLKHYKKIKDRPIDIKVEIISTHEGTFVDPNNEECRVLGDVFEAVYRRSRLYFFAPGGTDATHMRNNGLKNCIVFGPSGGNAHSHNEHVNIDDVINVTKVYLLYMYRMLKA